MSAVGATRVQAIIITRKSWVLGHVGQLTDGQMGHGSQNVTIISSDLK